eukprot:Selendium_serpulae@DN5055_c1_g1_i3.p1
MFARLLSFLVCCTAVAVGDPNIRIFRSLQIPSSAEPVKGDGLLRIDEDYIEEGQAPSPNEAVDNLALAEPEVSLAEVSSEIVEAPVSPGELPAVAEVDETEDMGAIEEV